MAIGRRSFLKSAAALTFAPALLRGASAADDPIVIASMYDLSGGLEGAGKPMYDVLNFAVDEMNAAGGLLWAVFYALGAYALGSAASSVGSTITIAGYAVASAATVASIIVVRRSLRRLEQRAEEAFPEEPVASQALQLTAM